MEWLAWALQKIWRRMSVNVYLCGDSIHDRVLQAFYDGCPVEKSLRRVEQYEPSEIGVVFGIAKRAVPYSQFRGKVISEQIRLRQKVIILETGYINRGDEETNHYAVGFGGMNGRADFRNQNSPPDRWRKLGVELLPWRTIQGDKYILLCGQVPWDANVEHVHIEQWLLESYRKIKARTDRKVYFRPHPRALGRLALRDLEEHTGPIDWRQVHAVVTFNSNTAVEAIINGVPAFVEDIGSMATTVSSRSLYDIEFPWYPDRQRWAQDLAYAQWTPQEMREGRTWSHLTR